MTGKGANRGKKNGENRSLLSLAQIREHFVQMFKKHSALHK